MKKDIILDGLQKTTYMKDDMEGKIAVKEEVNIDSHLKHNKELLNMNDGYSKSRDLKRVAIEKSSQYSNYCFKCLGK
jgi:hypothetical protein